MLIIVAGSAGASQALLGNLKLATSTSTLREYKAALSGLSAFIGEIVAAESENDALEPALEVALVLLRDGPAGAFLVRFEVSWDGKLMGVHWDRLESDEHGGAVGRADRKSVV